MGDQTGTPRAGDYLLMELVKTERRARLALWFT
jgi:hypothetical protein